MDRRKTVQTSFILISALAAVIVRILLSVFTKGQIRYPDTALTTAILTIAAGLHFGENRGKQFTKIADFLVAGIMRRKKR